MRGLDFYIDLYSRYDNSLKEAKEAMRYVVDSKIWIEEALANDNISLESKKFLILRATSRKYGLKLAKKYNITNKEIKEFGEMYKNIGYFSLLKETNKRITLNDFKHLKKINGVDAFIKIAKKYKSITNKKIINTLQKLYDAFSRWTSGHSMGSSICFYIDNYSFFRIDNRSYYPSYSIYKEAHGYAVVEFKSLNELLNFEVIRGVPTIKKSNGKCIIFESVGKKQSWEIERREAFLYRDTHSFVSYLDAKKNYIKREKAIKRDLKDMDLKKFVGIKDFRDIGACQAGINRFLKDIGIDKNKTGGVRIDYLIELAKSKGKMDLLLTYLKVVKK